MKLKIIQRNDGSLLIIACAPLGAPCSEMDGIYAHLLRIARKGDSVAVVVADQIEVCGFDGPKRRTLLSRILGCLLGNKATKPA